MTTTNTNSSKKIYLVGKVLGADTSNIPALLMKRSGKLQMEYILQTSNKKEAEAAAKWHNASMVVIDG